MAKAPASVTETRNYAAKGGAACTRGACRHEPAAYLAPHSAQKVALDFLPFLHRRGAPAGRASGEHRPDPKVGQPQLLFALGAGRGRRPLMQKDGFVTSGVVGTIKERKLHSDPYFALFRKNFWRT